MKIGFDLTKEDMWIFGRYAAFRNIRFKLKLIKNIVLFALVIFLYCAFSKFKVLETIVFVMVFVLGYVYVQYKVLKLKVMKAYASKGAYLGAHELEIGQEGIREVLPVGEDFHDWANYHELIKYKRYIYVLWGENTGNIIPNKAFQSEADKLEFIRFVESKIKK